MGSPRSHPERCKSAHIAVELKAKAAKERSQELASALENLARCYLRLAEQAEAESCP